MTDAERLHEAENTIAWIATALPVLKTMCSVAGLTAGAAKAQEMIDYLEARKVSKKKKKRKRKDIEQFNYLD
jgi:hypothetical protein